MKIKNYQLFLLGFVTVSLLLLTGFKKPGVNNVPLAEKQVVPIGVKNVQFKNKESSVNSKQKKTKHKQSVLSAKNSTTENVEPQKPLDLSVPFKDSDNLLKAEQNRIAKGEVKNIFIAENKKKLRPLDLDSQMLMSQEPEVDKRKSFDGAGIVITLKR